MRILASFLWTLASSVTSVVVTYAVKRAIGSSMPAGHRQAKRIDTIANKPMSQRDLYIKAAGSLNDVRNRVDGWDVNGARANRPELRRDAFLAVNRLQPSILSESFTYMTARLFSQSMWLISEQPGLKRYRTSSS